MIGAVNPIYLRTLIHRITGFANITTRDMLVHLYDIYRLLNPTKRQEYVSHTKQRYDPNQPFETFIIQIEDSI